MRGSELDRRTARFFFGAREGARPATRAELLASADAVELLERCIDDLPVSQRSVPDRGSVRLGELRRLATLIADDIVDLREGSVSRPRPRPRDQAPDDGLVRDPTHLDSATLFERFRWQDITGPRRVDEVLQFVSEASRLLASSLDYETTLTTLTEIAVPAIADTCSIEMVVAPGESKILALKDSDPEKVPIIEQIYRDYPTSADVPGSVPHIIRTGTSSIVEDVSPDLFELVAEDEEHLRLLRALDVRSSIGVPITARGKVHGAMVLMCSSSGRRLTRADLAVAEELGRRAGLAIENARLYAESQAAIRLRDEFLTVASHEMRTPLHTARLQVGGLIHMLERSETGSPVWLQRLRKIDTQISHLGKLVTTLLDVSRIREGRLALEPEPTDLAELAKEVAARLRDEAARVESPISVQVSGDCVGTWDLCRIDQVVANLLTNALKFGAGRPIEVSVEGGADQVVLRVSDHGVGIAAGECERIFECFERAASVREFAGLGLGLWIVRQIVAAHAGEVCCRSSPGEGATFEVTLPRTIGEGLRQPPAAEGV